MDLSKASAGGEPAATWDVPQLCPVPGMSFRGMQGQCCPGHTVVPIHVMPRANPVLAGNPREAAPEQRFSFSQLCLWLYQPRQASLPFAVLTEPARCTGHDADASLVSKG